MEGLQVINVTIPDPNVTAGPVVWPDCTFFNFIVWGIIASFLSMFGFFGNSLSLAAFQRDRRMSATTLLQCLAVSDFMLLLAVFITDSLPYICDYTGTCSNHWYTWPYIRYIWLVVPTSHMCSIWFVVLIAVNRYYAVCRPHDMRKAWCNQNTAIYVIVVIVFIVAFNLPRFFEYEIVEVRIDNETAVLKEIYTEFGNTSSYKVVYKVMLVNICLVLVPIVLLVVLTTKILVSLRTTIARRRSDKKNRSPSARSASKSASEITFVLILVVVVAIICQTPLAVFHFVRYWQKYYCGDFVYYLDNISKLLVNVNSSVNFVIYCLASKKFRRLLLIVVCCNGKAASSFEPFSTTSMKMSRRADYSLKSTIRDNDCPPGP